MDGKSVFKKFSSFFQVKDKVIKARDNSIFFNELEVNKAHHLKNVNIFGKTHLFCKACTSKVKNGTGNVNCNRSVLNKKINKVAFLKNQ